jgi:hypothetical protein
MVGDGVRNGTLADPVGTSPTQRTKASSKRVKKEVINNVTLGMARESRMRRPHRRIKQAAQSQAIASQDCLSHQMTKNSPEIGHGLKLTRLAPELAVFGRLIIYLAGMVRVLAKSVLNGRCQAQKSGFRIVGVWPYLCFQFITSAAPAFARQLYNQWQAVIF